MEEDVRQAEAPVGQCIVLLGTKEGVGQAEAPVGQCIVLLATKEGVGQTEAPVEFVPPYIICGAVSANKVICIYHIILYMIPARVPQTKFFER